MPPRKVPPSSSGRAPGERPTSLWSSYVDAAAHGHPDPATQVSTGRRLSAIVKKAAPPGWSKKGKGGKSSNSWVELETQAVGGGGVGAPRELWNDEDHQGDEHQYIIGDDDDDDKINFGVMVPGSGGGFLQGETRAPFSAAQAQVSAANKRSSSYGTQQPSKGAFNGVRRSTSGPTLSGDGQSTTPPIYFAPSLLPSNPVVGEAPQQTRAEQMAAERERRVAEHRVKMQLRKEEEDLEELRIRNLAKASVRQSRAEAKGFQWKEEGGAPAMPSRKPISKGDGEVPTGAAAARPRRMSHQPKPELPVALHPDDDLPTSIHEQPSPSFYSTAPLDLPVRKPSVNKRLTTNDDLPRPPSIFISDHDAFDPPHIAESFAELLPPPALLSPGGTPLSPLPEQDEPEQTTLKPVVLPSPLVSPLGGSKIATYPARSASDAGLEGHEKDPSSYFPVSLATKDNATTSSAFSSPQRRAPPVIPSSSRRPLLDTKSPTTGTQSLLAPSDGFYDASRKSPSGSARSSPTPLQSVIDDYTHSSDEEDEDGQKDNAWEDEDEQKQIKRRSLFAATSLDPLAGGGAGVPRKVSAPFAFDEDEPRPVSFALPSVYENDFAAVASLTQRPVSNISVGGQSSNNHDSRDFMLPPPVPPKQQKQGQQDFRVGEGQRLTSSVCGGLTTTQLETFPKKMIRKPSLVAIVGRDGLMEGIGQSYSPDSSPQSSPKKVLGGVAKIRLKSRSRSRNGPRGGRATSLEEGRGGAGELPYESTTGLRVGGGGGEMEEDGPTRRLAHAAMLFPFAMLGLLVRIGMNALAGFEGNAVPALLWSQGIGCLMFGLVLGKREELNFLYPPLWTGLAVGFAETITSFSGWMLQTFLAFSNFDETSRGPLQDLIDGLSLILITLLTAYSTMSFGLHLSTLIPPFPFHLFHPPSSRTNRLDVLAVVISVVLYVVTLICFFVLDRSYRTELTYPLILVPAGALVRYLVARSNPRDGRYGGRECGLPWGTMVGNLFGTGLLGALFVLQRGDGLNVDGGGCSAIGALSVGFAGSLTSVPALVYQARGSWKNQLWRWGYVVGLVAAGQVLLVAVVGSVWWSGTVNVNGFCSTISSV